jgi:hypothetical protein
VEKSLLDDKNLDPEHIMHQAFLIDLVNLACDS